MRWAIQGGGVSVGEYLVIAFSAHFKLLMNRQCHTIIIIKTKLLLVSVEMNIMQQVKHLSQRLSTIKKISSASLWKHVR